jgi:iron(III) transport system permease protein
VKMGPSPGRGSVVGPRAPRRRPGWPGFGDVVVGVGLIVFVVAPLLVLAARALGLPHAPTLARVALGFVDHDARAALWASTWTSAATTVFATALGVPVAFALGRLDLPRAAAWRAWLTLPAVVPPYLMGIAWVDLASPRNGLLNLLARALGASGPVVDVYGAGGIVWVMGLSYMPFVLLPTLAALERMDASLEESARLSGAGPLRVTLEISLPLVLPAIVSGAVLVYLAAAATFGVPYLLGTAGGERFWVLTTAIVSRITVGGAEALDEAVGLAAALLASSLLVVGLGAWATRRERTFMLVSGKSGRPRRLDVSAGVRRVVVGSLGLVVLVSAALPLLTLTWVSLLDVWGSGLGPDNWSLGTWRRVLLENRQTGPALLRSFGLAALAASASVVVGGLLAHRRARRPSAWTRVAAALVEVPYAIPGTVVALALLATFSQRIRVIVLERASLVLDLFAGSGALLAAYVVKYLAFGVRLGASGLAQLDPSLEESARVAGASPTRAAVDVVAPLLAPSLGAAWLLVFLPVLSEVTMSVLLVGPGTPVVGTVLFELQSYADPPSAAVLAVVLVALTVAGNAAARRVGVKDG